MAWTSNRPGRVASAAGAGGVRARASRAAQPARRGRCEGKRGIKFHLWLHFGHGGRAVEGGRAALLVVLYRASRQKVLGPARNAENPYPVGNPPHDHSPAHQGGLNWSAHGRAPAPVPSPGSENGASFS